MSARADYSAARMQRRIQLRQSTSQCWTGAVGYPHAERSMS